MTRVDESEIIATELVAVRRPSYGERLGFQRFSGLYVWVLIILVFSLWQPHTFFVWSNVRIVASSQAITAMLALAAVVPLITGAFDLSVAAMMGFSAVVVADLQMHGVNALLAILITLCVGLLVGVVNALIVVRLGVNAFIGTLAMTSVLAAGGVWLTNDKDVVSGLSSDFLTVGQWKIPRLGFSTSFLFMLAIAAILWYVLQYTPIGRTLYAAGDNPQAAKLAGVRVSRVYVGSFLTSATLATVVGIIYVSQVGVASLVLAPPYLLPAFSAVFLGATQIVPGRFNVIGTLVGVYVLATGVDGLQLTVHAPWISQMFTGLTLIVAVALSVRGRRRVL